METELKVKTPLELFEQFYSSEAYNLNAKETMQYAADVTNEHDFLTIADEIHVFIGILLLDVIIQIPVNVIIGQMLRPWNYTLVKNAMPRNRFQKLKSYLHFVDNRTVNKHV
ncbi:uncharacterized protein TNCV_450421 [Trichonephila clavipes]|nr:uncharacterized protein TNCV_450421 [Trichonephila clavipes]